jgi:hypothetical protein
VPGRVIAAAAHEAHDRRLFLGLQPLDRSSAEAATACAWLTSGKATARLSAMSWNVRCEATRSRATAALSVA